MRKKDWKVYPDTSSLRTTRLDKAIFEIAQEIDTLFPPSIERNQLQGLPKALPHILEDFAFRIGREDPETKCCRLMYLVHRYNPHIVDAIIESFTDEGDDSKVEEAGSMPVDEKISPWKSKNDVKEMQSGVKYQWVHYSGPPEEFEDAPELQEYSNILLHSPAYAWLQDAIHRALDMVTEGVADMHKQVREVVLTAMHREAQLHVSPRKRPTTQTVQIEVPWMLRFFESQGYPTPWSEVLPQIIVLTGSTGRVWASTVRQYLGSIWKRTGLQVLELLQKLLDDVSMEHDCTIFGNTELSARIQGSVEDVLTIRIHGIPHIVAEVATILTWLSGALRASTREDCTTYGLTSCVPRSPGFKDDSSRRTVEHELAFQINYGSEMNPPLGTGACWMGLFGNPVVVTGFMTPCRQDPVPGCEIPLEMMADLARSRKISNFGGRLMIKGFSTALIPTAMSDGCIFWHAVTSPDGDYLSFSDSRIKDHICSYPSGLTISDLVTSRHIVGWCPETIVYTGSRMANYQIDWSGLPKPRPGCAFEKVSIVGGQFITGGVSCIIGKKDKAVHVRSRDDYTMRLKWISKKFVVLYDVVERRAWLVDGVSALLHLVRASLKRDATDAFKSHFLFQESGFQEAPPDIDGKSAAIHILTNRNNTALPLYSKPDSLREETSSSTAGVQSTVIMRTKTDYCLKDRIESICDILEQIMAHQADVTSQDGVGFRVKCTTHRQLEGFDFMDIATDEDPFWPRITTLQSGGKGWVDFIRAIQAITLFGSGFGDLIRPAPQSDHTPPVRACSGCNYNTNVPPLCDYLAVCVSDIQEIIQKRGSQRTTPLRLVDDIYWHAPTQPFEICRCTGETNNRPDRVQVLLPGTFSKLWARNLRSPSLAASPRGALLFGHSRGFPLRWGDKGDPDVGQPELSIDDLEATFHDSGIGSSMGASSDGSAAPGNSPRSSEGPEVASEAHQSNKRPQTALLDTSSSTVEEPSRRRQKLIGMFSGRT
ncbi:nucleoside phosphorylase [Apiospora marii]|uniref:Nucleoside phosphorylase n=1 Tax=Apiospora marii TaxID=335849 RepID=A0ABR1R6G3_9PEZI